MRWNDLCHAPKSLVCYIVPRKTINPHDPALCDLPVCGPCGSYGDNYVAGKAKALKEIGHRLDQPHMIGCGCEPCRTIRCVLEAPARRELWARPVVN